MLNKLAFNGFKSRWKDYLVLFSGLLISSAIFYMFETLAMNKQFLQSNSPVAVTPIVFQMGTVLLVIITIVYILYANTFLMSMRQKEYGMFLVLGTKNKTIRRLIAVETLVIGLVSTIVGMILGMGLTVVVANALAKQLNANLAHLQSIYVPAIISTLVVFGLIFIFSALKNSWTIAKQPILQLLKGQQKPHQVSVKFGFGQLLQLISGLVALGIGYWALGQVTKLQMTAFAIALVTIVLGTYWTINTLFRLTLNWLRRSNFALRDLHGFTLGQLNFRIVDYTKILSMVSILFALSLGAFSVGLSFNQNVQTLTNRAEYYDLVVNNANAHEDGLLQKLAIKQQQKYDYKIINQHVYFKQSQLQQHPWHQFAMKNGSNTNQVTTPSLQQLQDLDSNAGAHFNRQLQPAAIQKPTKLVSDKEFNQLQAPVNQVQFVQVKDFYGQTDLLTKIVTSQNKRYPQLVTEGAVAKVTNYTMINEMFSGLEFMGFFLGIAFLAMLASCLMFKILSSADQDIVRYQMLHKIGARQKILRKSINQELGLLFGIPAVMGIIHVLFGMRLFSSLLSNPYHNIMIPIAIFLILYFIYYYLTISLYKLIVLKKK